MLRRVPRLVRKAQGVEGVEEEEGDYRIDPKALDPSNRAYRVSTVLVGGGGCKVMPCAVSNSMKYAGHMIDLKYGATQRKYLQSHL